MYIQNIIKLKIIYFFIFLNLLLINNFNKYNSNLITKIKNINALNRIINSYDYSIIYAYKKKYIKKNKKDHIKMINSLEDFILSKETPYGRPLRIIMINIEDENFKKFKKSYSINKNINLMFFYKSTLIEIENNFINITTEEIKDLIYKNFIKKQIFSKKRKYVKSKFFSKRKFKKNDLKYYDKYDFDELNTNNNNCNTNSNSYIGFSMSIPEYNNYNPSSFGNIPYRYAGWGSPWYSYGGAYGAPAGQVWTGGVWGI